MNSSSDRWYWMMNWLDVNSFRSSYLCIFGLSICTCIPHDRTVEKMHKSPTITSDFFAIKHTTSDVLLMVGHLRIVIGAYATKFLFIIWRKTKIGRIVKLCLSRVAVKDEFDLIKLDRRMDAPLCLKISPVLCCRSRLWFEVQCHNLTFIAII